MIGFKIRKGNIELRSCNEQLLQEGEHTIAEIVQWCDNDTYCITIAYFKKNKEDEYYLEFVGGRPFEYDIDPINFMRLAKIGHHLLNID